MPIYTVSCKSCSLEKTKIVPIAQRDAEFLCDCGGSMLRLIDKPGMVWSPTRNGGFTV